ncbi:MAG: M48 family metalloprotease [Drouetiella hepatica Uher 2000/2452]|jgi:predicted Zn-dependent protease|uniref:M48 family metalloprotease n=1 Tax=Drouetiella hepatica Uher 2000/2452 TaxID=904376 RepID=A0A951Q6X0_9CYAN|nr:M48 family metalloprotease [Drouetiella hepatica Uher 2000/2452]
MIDFLANFSAQLRRRWLYGMISMTITLGLIMGTPRPAPAIPIIELLFRGIQLIQLSNMSDSQEVSLGSRINQQLTRSELKLYSDRAVTEYVNQIGQKLVPQSDRPNIPYVFQVVDMDAVNAFATMGGYVYVTKGLMKTADNEAQLASVIGHEIGHIAARHAVEQMRQKALEAGLASAAGLDRNTAVNIGVELAINRPNSRQAEFEADQKGLVNLERVGYAPSAMVAFMEKLQSQRSVPTFLSTHPATGDRIEALNQEIDPATANSGTGLDTAAYRSKISSIR